MTVRFLLAALAAGLLAGLLMTAVQQWKVVPLIMEAEAYENSLPAHDHGAADTGSATESHQHGNDDAGSNMLFGLSRFGGTLLANLVTGAGYGLLAGGAAMLLGFGLNARNGLLLGIAGWIAVQLLPAVGLPPELPGFPYADLQERQLWWIATVAFSAIGLWLLVLRPEIASKVGGVILLLLPHLYGAPRPEDIASDVPAYLASEYAAATLATTLFFWAVMGTALGLIWNRFGQGE